jgi:hypothetical protein
MNKQTEDVSGAGKFFFFLFGLGSGILKAFTISKYWAWFAVPFGLVSFNTAQALALLFFLTIFKNLKDFSWEERKDRIVNSFSTSIVLLIFGWILTFFA